LGQSHRSARWTWDGRRVLRAALASILICGAILLGEAGAATLIAPSLTLPASVPLLADSAGTGSPPPETFALAMLVAALAVIAFVTGEWLRRGAARVEAR